MTKYSFLICLIPALSFVMIVFFLRWKEKLSAGWSIASILISWVMSIIVLIETISRNGQPYEASYRFINLPGINIEIGILVDALTAIMLVVVTTVGACVEIYSVGYMRGDSLFSRFFAYLSLFLFSMLGLVLANNFFMIFIFWELVGLTSYLLIGFWFEKKSAANACKKAFITTRIGDLGFLVGLFLIAFYCGTFNYGDVFAKLSAGVMPLGVLTATAIFVFSGAVGKSAQFPLHVWLPDAMEGPTPVSALIHAATMVAAGVYLVARAMPMFIGTGNGAMVVAIIGLITSLLAATIALTQNDIKRVLAYSTVSQLGYMIMALGLYGYDTYHGSPSVGYFAGTFHLMNHAFFKGLLFLAAGSVIHGIGTNDIREMGGLYPKMKTTAITFMIASLSISGIFPFSGFWSKDEIVASTLHHPVFLILTLTIAFMTAFYMWRLCFMTFTGKPRDLDRFNHAHESPRVMTWPLAFLAFLAVVSGWVGMPWLHHGFSSFVYAGAHAPEHHAPSYALMIISLCVALSGIGLAYLMYYKKSISPEAIGQRFRLLYKLSFNKFYFDEIYQVAIINPIMSIARFMWSFDVVIIDGAVNGTAWLTILLSDIKQWFDVWIIDGAVNGSGWVVRQIGDGLRFIQTGVAQSYALTISALVVLFGLIKFELVYLTWSWPIMTIIFVMGVTALILVSRVVVTRQELNSDISKEDKV
ncbi:MAG: NADH-quinone oxidoreductase subunit L [candidate division Zixibacteria bacterium]|nr:NADH-quinone oxidoreductase subunit L [candidate division Zixibacteria bacterium]